MSKHTMRVNRRQLITWFLQSCGSNLSLCKSFVREQEVIDYGFELNLQNATL